MTGRGWGRRTDTLVRYLLWAGVLLSANANRRHFGLASTWVFHTIGNSVTLMLPDLLRLAGLDRPGPVPAWRGMVRDVVANNQGYAASVAPLALGYILSHPRWNIYKGAWGALHWGVFGLDSIPHATTAGGLVTLTLTSLDALGQYLPPDAPVAGWIPWARGHPVRTAAVVLGLATLVYETAEWAIHVSELAATGGDPSRINMEWSLSDTLADSLANALGGLAAVALYLPQHRARTIR
jgi:hypothetical protein